MVREGLEQHQLTSFACSRPEIKLVLSPIDFRHPKRARKAREWAVCVWFGPLMSALDPFYLASMAAGLK